MSRAQQTNTALAAESNDRTDELRHLLQDVSAPETRFAANQLAGLTSMRTALVSADPASAVTQLLDGGVATSLNSGSVTVFNTQGRLLDTTAPSLAGISKSMTSVHRALGGRAGDGVEVVNSVPTWDVAAPVFESATSKTLLGVVLYSVPLDVTIKQLMPAVTPQGYSAILVTNNHSTTLDRITVTSVSQNGATTVSESTSAVPSVIAKNLPSTEQSINPGLYNQGGKNTEVAGTLVGLSDPLQSKIPAVYVGVEAPAAPYLALQSGDQTSLLLLSLTALAVIAFGIFWFVNRFVRQPVAKLSTGVSRIAGGDYTQDIPVESRDELGVLATQVNKMRAQIESNIKHIDGAVTRLGEVSHALTTTTAGIRALEHAVCATAADMAGEGASAHLMTCDGTDFYPSSAAPESAATPQLSGTERAVIIAGKSASWESAHGHHFAVPMNYQEKVVGTIVVTSAQPITDADGRALAALANNAAVALENTRLFEREKETVQKLRELDAMKSDFLSTAQHELRTPVTAILGQIELLRMLWEKGDEQTRLGIVTDIEISTRLLQELLETIIDFSLFNADTVHLSWGTISVKSAANAALDEVTKHFHDGLPVKVRLDIQSDLAVRADQRRFVQVLRSLLDNAVKFSRKGGEVTISAHENGERCTITVSDKGIGIPADAITKIFDRFYQVDNTATRSFGGMGMGLALVRAICDVHGAACTVTSEVGTGTQFTLDWPRALPQTKDGGIRGHIGEFLLLSPADLRPEAKETAETLIFEVSDDPSREGD